MEHIAVCICTYKRPLMLERLLKALTNLETNKKFTYSINVVDNDRQQSARQVVEEFISHSKINTQYIVEPRQNIARARNAAVDKAAGDYIAFIDDDEIPHKLWLQSHFDVLSDSSFSGSLGPVRPEYPDTCPLWVVEGGFHKREELKNGTILKWTQCRTGNVVFRSNVLKKKGLRFDPSYGSGGEDRDLFRRLIKYGNRFVWNINAPVFETVPLHRCRRMFMLKRGILRGSTVGTTGNLLLLKVFRSFAAISVYTVILPFAFVYREATFMKYLISCCDHLGLILRACGIHIIKETYIS